MAFHRRFAAADGEASDEALVKQPGRRESAMEGGPASGNYFWRRETS
jgi:hypothetical protein